MNKGANTKGMTVLFSVSFAVLFLVSSALLFSLGKTALGVKPDILLAMAIVCPLFCTTKTSALLALIFGTLSDLSVTPAAHFSPVLFVLCAFFVPKLASVFNNNRAAEAAVCSLPFVLLRSLTGVFYLLSAYEDAKFVNILTKCIIPEFLCNVAAVIVVHFVMKFLVRKFRLEHRQYI